MRNLSLQYSSDVRFESANIVATAFDLEESTLYIAAQQISVDGELTIDVWRVCVDPFGIPEGSPTLFTTFTVPAPSPSVKQLVSFRFLAETRQLLAILRCGDITLISSESDPPAADVEGTIEPGILAASWSPDESLVAIVSEDEKLFLMTSTFDVLTEAPLETTEFGEDRPINAGWGSKQTQFHGSLGKAAAQTLSVAVGCSPDDDGLPRISWRGDGAFFVVSSVSPSGAMPHRVLRVYDRQCALQTTSEPVPGLEHGLVWRPSGNLIVSTQRFGFEGGGAGKEGRHDVVFFERNGLRHGEFALRTSDLKQDGAVSPLSSLRKWGYRVKELSWSPDSTVLGAWIECDDGDIVQLWTTSNYHWLELHFLPYLKQEIQAPSHSKNERSRFTSVEWHPEEALSLILTTNNQLQVRKFAWATARSPCSPPVDSGTVAVIDGSDLFLTPFRVQNIPPPMSSHELRLAVARTPAHLAFSPVSDLLAVLWENGCVELWDLHTRLENGRGKVIKPEKLSSEALDGEDSAVRWRQVQLICNDASDVPRIVALGTNANGIDMLASSIRGTSVRHTLPGGHGRLSASLSDISWQSQSGALYNGTGAFPQFCFDFCSLNWKDSVLHIGLSASGSIFVVHDDYPSVTLAANGTSFTVTSGFLIYTTSAHDAIFAPLDDLRCLESTEELPAVSAKWERRAVERGSRIVVAVPSTMNLVLQMPRGNLETISPRPLVMEVIRQDIDSCNYRKAFLACRKHRIDLNHLVLRDRERFLQSIGLFVDQVHEVDHINLFLTAVGRGTQPSEAIAQICDAIRIELEKRDLARYVNSILTAYVMMTPPDYEAGLSILPTLREQHPSIVEDAVKYIIFLVDSDKLFDTALGMYDFSLVLMIAQHSQKDPREYLPFLRELRSLDKYYQRFRIDDHLQRHDSALRNLSMAGEERFDEALAYAEHHRLYTVALQIWRDSAHYQAVLDAYGDWLFERREFRQSAAVFIEAGRLSKGMASLEKALEWKDLFDLALRVRMNEEDVAATAYRVAEELGSKKRYAEAARILLDYAEDVREAVICLVQGNNFSEARRVVSLTHTPELIEDIIYPGAFESRSQIGEDIVEMRDQLRRQLMRIRELRIRKVEEPDAFYETEDSNLHNVDTMTDVSMPATAFTRYTVAPSAASRTSNSRSKRKAERKRGSGRKGTVDEEEYLLTSISKLAIRFQSTRGEALLPHLWQFKEDHRREGKALQAELFRLEADLREAVEEVWKSDDGVEGEQPTGSFLPTSATLPRPNPVEKIPKPDIYRIKLEEWQIKLYDLS
ncbi:IkappaB kinase complex, IKAP component [Fistulina hepatica ATCC 64428]|uniref:Elongator complex protein 1 n=1 Tax=Fistulina hepatica ATCC 64428 TaxID=1128425 RepID=A0A0D7A5U2_9AGAR|nr:IkappaB kinase complex, IKAP component [Fistulina hepatica ATCC 64428]